MTTPETGQHETVQIWTAANVSKFIVGLIFAVVAAVVTAIQPPVTTSGVLQVVVLGLGAVAVYIAPYSERGFVSAKVWVSGIAAVLTAVVPFVAQYVDTGDWHNLTGIQWLVVFLAVGKAVGVYVVPKTDPLEVPAALPALGASHTD